MSVCSNDGGGVPLQYSLQQERLGFVAAATPASPLAAVGCCRIPIAIRVGTWTWKIRRYGTAGGLSDRWMRGTILGVPIMSNIQF